MMISFLLMSFAFARQHHPTVVEIKGKVTVENLEKQVITPKLGQKFQGRAKFLVPARSFIKLRFHENTFVSLYEDTEFEFPIIEFESNAIPKMILTQGKIRYECQQQCTRPLEAPLYEDVIGPGDYVFWMNPKLPSFEVLILKGEMRFRGLENEKSVPLKAQEKASFKGNLENGEIAYDILLKGRKVARGELEGVQKASAAEIKEYSREQEIKKALAAKKATEAAKPKKQAGQICEAPFAKFNECSWVQTPKGCIRQRCNANGVWADQILVTQKEGRCSKQAVVAPCNY